MAPIPSTQTPKPEIRGLSDSDGALIEAARNGDREAFGVLVARHQSSAIKIAASILGGQDGAEDVAQDAFVKAHRALHTFDPSHQPKGTGSEDTEGTDRSARFEPWLFRIVANTARNRLRYQQRQANLARRAGSLAQDPGDGPDDLAQVLVKRPDVVTAINRLDGDDRQILAFRWYDQMGEAEIAEVIGIKRGTVKSRLHRAMIRLRRELGIAALIVLVTLAAVLAIAPARRAVAQWLGIGATTIEIVDLDIDGLSPRPENDSPAGTGPAADPEQTLADGIDPLPTLGPPTTSSELAAVDGHRFTWSAGSDLPALATTESGQGSLGAVLSIRPTEGPLDTKLLSSDLTIEPVSFVVDGRIVSGLWLPGTHAYLAAGTDEEVLSDRVLIWVDGDVQFRLEVNLSQQAAIELASAVEWEPT